MPLPLIPIAISLAKEFLPALVGKVAGDKSGRVAKAVIDSAADAAGIDAGGINSEVSAEAAARVIRADPNRMLQYQERMAELDNAETAMYLQDRQDARDRDVALHKAGYKNTRADLMIVCAFVCLLGIVAAIYFKKAEVPGEVLAIFNMAVGAILKMIGDAFQFEFGSSRGSKEKSLMMGKG